MHLKKSAAKRPIDATTVTVAASVAKFSSRLSTVEKFLPGAIDADQRLTVDQWTRLLGFWRNRALCGASVVPVLRLTPTVIASVAWIRSGLDLKICLTCRAPFCFFFFHRAAMFLFCLSYAAGTPCPKPRASRAALSTSPSWTARPCLLSAPPLPHAHSTVLPRQHSQRCHHRALAPPVLVTIKCTTLRGLAILRNSRVNLLRKLAFGLKASILSVWCSTLSTFLSNS
jgi:hypothetical protein